MGRETVHGVGVNDVGYEVTLRENVWVDGRNIRRNYWICPFYSRWASMLERCYSERFQKKCPTYRGCVVSKEWLIFSNFRFWMESQDWEGKQIDKDLLVVGNKLYSSETCVFVDTRVNMFTTERGGDRGEYPLGVSIDKRSRKFRSRCNNPFTKETEYLGLFACPQEAHKAWLKRKLELAKLLAEEQSDESVAKALVERYTNYHDSQ